MATRNNQEEYEEEEDAASDTREIKIEIKQKLHRNKSKQRVQINFY